MNDEQRTRLGVQTTFRPIPRVDLEGTPAMTTTTAPESVTYGWNYRPDTYRCERGWNDTLGASYGCRDAGVDEVGGEWLCEYHAKRAEAELATPIKCCTECRSDAHLPPLESEPGQWYFCLACDSEWYDDADDMPSDRPAFGDVLIAGLMLTFLSGSAMLVIYLCMRTAVLEDWHGGRAVALIALGFVSWLAAITVISEILRGVFGGLGAAVRYFRGDEGQEA